MRLSGQDQEAADSVMLEAWIWGETPPAFVRVRSGPKRIGLVRKEMQSRLSFDEIKRPDAPGAMSGPLFGRGGTQIRRLPSGESILVRSYRRGGLVRHLTADIFCTWPPRPFEELAITEAARSRGVPTLEIVGAWVERIWGSIYRGWLISRELSGARDLWSTLSGEPESQLESELLLRTVARSIYRMHQEGIYHGDLNLGNILVRRQGDVIQCYIIDFDKSKLYSHALAPGLANRNLQRFLRSWRKLDPEGVHFSEANWNIFLSAYHATRGR